MDIMSPRDIVCFYFQEYDKYSEEVDEILWSNTSWPYGDLEVLNNEIYAFYLRAKG